MSVTSTQILYFYFIIQKHLIHSNKDYINWYIGSQNIIVSIWIFILITGQEVFANQDLGSRDEAQGRRHLCAASKEARQASRSSPNQTRLRNGYSDS